MGAGFGHDSGDCSSSSGSSRRRSKFSTSSAKVAGGGSSDNRRNQNGSGQTHKEAADEIDMEMDPLLVTRNRHRDIRAMVIHEDGILSALGTHAGESWYWNPILDYKKERHLSFSTSKVHDNNTETDESDEYNNSNKTSSSAKEENKDDDEASMNARDEHAGMKGAPHCGCAVVHQQISNRTNNLGRTLALIDNFPMHVSAPFLNVISSEMKKILMMLHVELLLAENKGFSEYYEDNGIAFAENSGVSEDTALPDCTGVVCGHKFAGVSEDTDLPDSA